MTSHGAPIRIALVDDQALFRAGVRIILNSQPDFEVVGEANDGHEAIQLVDREEPDIVLMDLRMPELDGVEATRHIFDPQHVAMRTRTVRVIVLTTFNLDDRAATAIRYGASGFLLKDATPTQLMEAVRTVFTGNAVLAPQDLGLLLEGEFSSKHQPPVVLDSLTDKEREVLLAVARGLSNTEIASEFFVSESTVKTHIGSLLRKLAVRDRVQLVVFAYSHGLL